MPTSLPAPYHLCSDLQLSTINYNSSSPVQFSPVQSSKFLLDLASIVFAVSSPVGTRGLNYIRSKIVYVFPSRASGSTRRGDGLSEQVSQLLQRNSARVYLHSQSVRVRALALCEHLTRFVTLLQIQERCHCRLIQQDTH